MSKLTINQWIELIGYACFALAAWVPMIAYGVEVAHRRWRRLEPPRKGGGLLI